MRQDQLSQTIDWTTVFLFGAMVLLGWLNIYAAEYNPDAYQGILDFEGASGKQFIWILSALVLIVVLFLFDHNFFHSFAYVTYGIFILLLVFILIAGKEVAGSRSWVGIGSFGLQPSEFAKVATALALAKYLGQVNVKLTHFKSLMGAAAFVVLPMGLTILQGDTGTALVFLSFTIPLFRGGMPASILWVLLGVFFIFLLTLLLDQTVLLVMVAVISLLGVGLNARSPSKIFRVLAVSALVIFMIRSVGFVMSDVLLPHQQKRVLSLVNPNADPLGIGWNVTQSKIAIGSGGFSGKGFLEGTQTKFDFVPAQSTDFIFCTIGEEQGWLGSILLIALFVTLFLRLVLLAERQKSTFARMYGYSVVSILFFHFAVNIGMTIGLFPVVGIPLPFFSYGGSSLWSFTLLLFIFLKLDAQRMQMLHRG